ncbi:HlyD family efflux transporter periplasmic adaptor subunit [Halosquirtibacter laminarini]|uniref:HlyD family efflux transporter periplasmic adaptor subunit n=1 Tax=Halosquirtibacter laminarini TaxID=3374600 RepID=A0AC61NJ95_9BACT|nr:HlyD family efflux transporter periplasmic adaptor subunit [Prolixibacteraceae bacterium]
MKSLYISLLSLFVLYSCNTADPRADGYGNFEAADVVLSSQSSGKILDLYLKEGDKAYKGDTIAIIDTTDIVIRMEALDLQLKVDDTKITRLYVEASKTRDALKTNEKDQNRIHTLYNKKVATETQKDQIDLKVSNFKKTLQQLNLEVKSLQQHKESINNQLSLMNNHLSHCFIVSPIDATVLNRYKEPAEFVIPSNPIYKIASLDPLLLRIYISGAELSKVKLGQDVKVSYDHEGKLKKVTGTVAWISDQAEFTPKTIQTREERVAQVYAVKIRVPNAKGEMKIGMPGELHLN